MIRRGIMVGTNQPVEVTAEQGVIKDIRPYKTDTEERLPWISPGWIDLQVNGSGGFDLNGEAITFEDIDGVTKSLHTQGVTSYLPTIITGSHERMRRAAAAIAEYRRQSPLGASIAGIHLEGPYISSQDGSRGAHPREYVRDPDWEEFQRLQEAAEGLIKMVTMAPEREGAIQFIEKLVETGVVVAIGHTAADEKELDAAVRAGASVSTHLGNGSQVLLPRHPNYIWSQLADDRLWATFIPDGHHLSPAVLKAMTRVKGKKTIFVSDCTMFSAMPPGEYASLIGGRVVLTETGLLHTAENPNILAGSALSLATGVVNAVKFTDLDFAEAIEAITIRPATAMGWSHLGRLEVGSPANFTVFTYDKDKGQDLIIQETVVKGVSVFQHRGK